jgi:hypothetical protein
MGTIPLSFTIPCNDRKPPNALFAFPKPHAFCIGNIDKHYIPARFAGNLVSGFDFFMKSIFSSLGHQDHPYT